MALPTLLARSLRQCPNGSTLPFPWTSLILARHFEIGLALQFTCSYHCMFCPRSSLPLAIGSLRCYALGWTPRLAVYSATWPSTRFTSCLCDRYRTGVCVGFDSLWIRYSECVESPPSIIGQTWQVCHSLLLLEANMMEIIRLR